MAAASLAIALIVLVFGDSLGTRAIGLVRGKPSLEERIEQAIEECEQDGFSCRTTKSVVIANGTGELTAVGVDLVTEDELESRAGSAVLVFDSSGALRWKSPIQSFAPGYGLGALETDVTNHLFVSFAVTNHSGIAWVLDPSTTPVQTFGTVGGSGLVIDGYEEPNLAGLRRLTAYREGWPANTLNPTTSRDVFEWNGTTYVFKSCEIVGQRSPDGELPVRRVIPAGTGTCKHPIGKYSVDLDGDRAASTQPP